MRNLPRALPARREGILRRQPTVGEGYGPANAGLEQGHLRVRETEAGSADRHFSLDREADIQEYEFIFILWTCDLCEPAL